MIKKFFVYKITNTINNKIYIGYTGRTIIQRWKSHKSAARNGSPFRFHSAIRKYGPDSWKLECLYETEIENDAQQKEQYYIQKFKTNDIIFGYNANSGGCGGWIVPNNKLKNWKREISKRTKGFNNPNSIKITNKNIIDIGLDFVKTYNFVPGYKRLLNFAKEKYNLDLPKSFSKFRFDGSTRNVPLEIEKICGIKYNPYYRKDRKKIYD
jgi:group I intron endonuclease